MTLPNDDNELATPIAVEDSSLVEQLAEEMAERWRTGQHPLAEEYLARHPELWHRPDAALELVAEELALREEYESPISRSQLVARFPQWAEQVRTLGDCQRVFGRRPEVARFPQVGNSLGEFRLITELGRGAHGQVFLATQGSLGGRSVVLKLAPPGGGEHLALARLQHTHIVPLHSTHEFPDRGLRGLCMPYFGGGTLAALLAALANRPVVNRMGADLLAALWGAQASIPAPLSVRGPACDALARSSYTAAVCRIGVCLADALHFAHERGLLHLDLKPSNVLIAADGTPMLLDFHLARPPLSAGDVPPAWLGGTPGYIAPELAAAVQAVRSGTRIPIAVDARTDVYSLGILLAEALGHTPTNPNPHVSVGLADILARCSAPEPAERYPSANDVAVDLRRHLADLPLKGVANRSLAERWRKWRRRRPYALSIVAILLALAIGGVSLAIHTGARADRATAALNDGETRLREGRFSEAAELLRNGESLVAGLPFPRSLCDRLRDARVRAAGVVRLRSSCICCANGCGRCMPLRLWRRRNCEPQRRAAAKSGPSGRPSFTAWKGNRLQNLTGNGEPIFSIWESWRRIFRCEWRRPKTRKPHTDGRWRFSPRPKRCLAQAGFFTWNAPLTPGLWDCERKPRPPPDRPKPLRHAARGNISLSVALTSGRATLAGPHAKWTGAWKASRVRCGRTTIAASVPCGWVNLPRPLLRSPSALHSPRGAPGVSTTAGWPAPRPAASIKLVLTSIRPLLWMQGSRQRSWGVPSSTAEPAGTPTRSPTCGLP